MSDSVKQRAYAKLNLALSVTGRRGDYHTIETLFQSIDLFDVVTLTKGQGREITSDFPSDNSLVVLSALQKAYGLGGMHLSTEKHIPLAGGLGGSSADAAASAIACARLYGLPEREVFDRVKDLFGDVAFQMTKGTAIGRGIGSELTPLAPLTLYHVLLAFPSAGVSTKEAYERCDRTPHLNADLTALYEALMRGESAQCHYVNDLLPPALELNDEIAPLLTEMSDDKALLTGMSGSGSTLFSLYKTADDARAKAATLSVPTLVTTTFSPERGAK